MRSTTVFPLALWYATGSALYIPALDVPSAPSSAVYQPSTSAYKPSTSVYTPSPSAYKPSSAIYKPSTATYTPSTAVPKPTTIVTLPSTGADICGGLAKKQCNEGFFCLYDNGPASHSATGQCMRKAATTITSSPPRPSGQPMCSGGKGTKPEFMSLKPEEFPDYMGAVAAICDSTAEETAPYVGKNWTFESLPNKPKSCDVCKAAFLSVLKTCVVRDSQSGGTFSADGNVFHIKETPSS